MLFVIKYRGLNTTYSRIICGKSQPKTPQSDKIIFMKKSKSTKKNNKVNVLSQEIAIQTLTLASSALGLVAALAWNEAITEYINIYIKPHLAKGSGVISLFIYAIFITAITVLIAMQMARAKKKLGS